MSSQPAGSLSTRVERRDSPSDKAEQKGNDAGITQANAQTGASASATTQRTSGKEKRGNWKNSRWRGRRETKGGLTAELSLNEGTTSASNTEGQEPNIKTNSNKRSKNTEKPKQPPRPRPTHFLALPLHNHPALRTAVANFQAALFEPREENARTRTTSTTEAPSGSKGVEETQQQSNEQNKVQSRTARGKAKAGAKVKLSPVVQGLDTSILIDPRRLHMTLGVMTLEKEEDGKEIVGEGKGEDKATLEIHESRVEGQTTSVSISQHDQLEVEATLETSVTITAPLSRPRKTISTALALLQSLKPQISAILDGSTGVDVPLEVLDTLKTEKLRPPRGGATNPNSKRAAAADEDVTEGLSTAIRDASKSTGAVKSTERNAPPLDSPTGEASKESGREQATVLEVQPARVGAGVLFLGPSHIDKGQLDVGRQKLMQICYLVEGAFKDAGYITDTRPLKLHCTIVNASHRKPMRRMPFSYSDILDSSRALASLGAAPLSIPEHPSGLASTSRTSSDAASGSHPDTNVPQPGPPLESEQPVVKQASRKLQVPPPVPVNLGLFHVDEIQLWEMGSHTENNEYRNCGGVVLA
ncbi:hypothetical protein CPC08DRAFT_768609 [Agrocybe pediades]|nr:hypothetical protein CPC08DRAFT_768609 [Agrocybe pediades]